jgi:hypothetical protein
MPRVRAAGGEVTPCDGWHVYFYFLWPTCSSSLRAQRFVCLFDSTRARPRTPVPTHTPGHV